MDRESSLALNTADMPVLPWMDVRWAIFSMSGRNINVLSLFHPSEKPQPTGPGTPHGACRN